MITVLHTSDGASLTKTFAKEADGSISKKSYDKAYLFDVKTVDVRDISDLSALLTMIENDGSKCIIRGQLKPGACDGDVRRLLYDDGVDQAVFEEPPRGSPWLMIDFDKIPAPAWLPADLRHQYLLDMLPPFFENVSYHYRWSASAAMNGWKTLSCHFWFWLTGSWRSDIIRKRIETENWEGVDDAPFSPVQIHYTANPKFVGMDDPISVQRSGLVQLKRDAVDLPPFRQPAPVRKLSRFPVSAAPMSFEAKFQEMLNKIGPNYHVPVRNAIRWYVGHAKPVDAWELKSRVESAIARGAPGKSDIREYNSSYLDRSINGAMRKF